MQGKARAKLRVNESPMMLAPPRAAADTREARSPNRAATDVQVAAPMRLPMA
jgi:hypothetical protein